MGSTFDSFDQSPLGEFIESPLEERNVNVLAGFCSMAIAPLLLNSTVACCQPTEIAVPVDINGVTTYELCGVGPTLAYAYTPDGASQYDKVQFSLPQTFDCDGCVYKFAYVDVDYDSCIGITYPTSYSLDVSVPIPMASECTGCVISVAPVYYCNIPECGGDPGGCPGCPGDQSRVFTVTCTGEESGGNPCPGSNQQPLWVQCRAALVGLSATASFTSYANGFCNYTNNIADPEHPWQYLFSITDPAYPTANPHSVWGTVSIDVIIRFTWNPCSGLFEIPTSIFAFGVAQVRAKNVSGFWVDRCWAPVSAGFSRYVDLSSVEPIGSLEAACALLFDAVPGEMTSTGPYPGNTGTVS